MLHPKFKNATHCIRINLCNLQIFDLRIPLKLALQCHPCFEHSIAPHMDTFKKSERIHYIHQITELIKRIIIQCLIDTQDHFFSGRQTNGLLFQIV